MLLVHLAVYLACVMFLIVWSSLSSQGLACRIMGFLVVSGVSSCQRLAAACSCVTPGTFHLAF